MALERRTPGVGIFVSHASEDEEIATTLRHNLIDAGIEVDDPLRIGHGLEWRTDAVERADIAILLLSPEYIAEKRPMGEMMFFLERRKRYLSEKRANNSKRPTLFTIIPVFYRLSIEDLKKEPNFLRRDKNGENVYRKTDFLERSDDGEPEADENRIREALQEVMQIQGVVNEFTACNRDDPFQKLLIDDVREGVFEVMAEHIANREEPFLLPHEKLQKVVLQFASIPPAQKGMDPRSTDKRLIKCREFTLNAEDGNWN